MYLGRLILAFLGFMVLIILVIVLFIGGGKKTNTPTVPVKTLTSYANTNATVSMTIDGPVNGDDAHRAIQVTVGQNSRTLDVFQGYNHRVIQNNSFSNNQSAYNTFLHAIDFAGFSLQRKGTAANLDDTGQCALEDRFIYTLQQDGKTISRLWTSSCGTSTGNFAGNSQALQDLFEAQITEYQTLIQDIDLGL